MTSLSKTLGESILNSYGDIVESLEAEEAYKLDLQVQKLLVLEQIWLLDERRLDQILERLRVKNDASHTELVGLWEKLPHRLVNKHWQLARQAAATYHIDSEYDNEEEFKDLLGACQEVLYIAARKFIRRSDHDFKSYVWPLLREKIRETQQSRHVVPPKIRLKLKKLDSLRELYHYQDKTLNPAIIAEELGLGEQETQELLAIEADWGTAQGFESIDNLEDLDEVDETPDVLSILVQQEDQAMMKKALERLGDREKLLIQRLYFEDHTVRELASKLGMSLSIFRKVHKRALRQLKESVADQEQS